MSVGHNRCKILQGKMALSLSTMPRINTRGEGGTLHMKGVGMLIRNFEWQCTVVNLNGWSSSPRKCYFDLFIYTGFSWECQGGLRVLARSDNHIFTVFLADENDLLLFQAEKRQQVCETGQRLRSLESGLRGQQHYILGIFWNLFVVLYSGILTPILLFTILYMVVTYAILHVISSECQFKSFRRLVTVPGSRS